METSHEVVIDVLGREHRFAGPPSRIVSLVPSLTETLFDLGAGESVVGVTDYCIFPDIPAATARLGGTKGPDIEKVRALRPDLVYVNVEENLRRHAEAIGEFAPVFATEPSTVNDVQHLIEQLGAIHARHDRAREWNDRLGTAVERARSGRLDFTFACAIWKDPWMWCGGDTYVSDLVSTVGGRNVFSERERYPRVEVEELLALAPDVLFLPDEPYEFGDAERADLQTGGFERVIGPFPGHLFTWHGTRTLAGIHYLMEVMKVSPEPGEEVAQAESRRSRGPE